MRRGLALVAAAACAAGRAEAHAFQGGAGAYEQVIEGAAVILGYPGLLLPLLALGIAVSLWDSEGLPRVWPGALAGQVAGILAAPLAGVWIAPAVMALGVGVAALAALWPDSRRDVIAALAVATGLGVMMSALEGHGLFELPLFIHLGLVFAANLVLAAGAGAAALTLERVAAPWMRIGWRVVASWIGAILLLVLAFTLRGGVS
ncbi:hypothetical protein [Roseicyclus persicicus]|uniref:HupE/UreJ family protein n=1 Tax=Roseicyclus persicicus TaxID=2650661 RepID=A0A7X6JWX8_9RHOB|nr:hypothetical protein [Roseibacterium persicicum]NKX44937.1 hypothetical protein [Roseibacterium persicicum]